MTIPLLADGDVCVVGSGSAGSPAARRSYWTVHRGRAGMTFLLGAFSAQMAERGIDAAARHAMFVTNPARVLAFAR